MKMNYKMDNPEETHLPTLVLINGLFASLESWNGSVRELARHFRLLRYDCRGQGKSPRPKGPYLLLEHVEDLKNLLDELNIENCCLLGISNGGRIALSFAKHYPNRIIAMAVADTYAELSPLLEKKLESWKEANRLGGPGHRFNVASPWVWGESFLQEKPDLLDFYRKQSFLENTDVIEGLINGALKGDVAIEDIHVPTLLVVGEEDLLTPPFMHVKMLSRMKNARMSTVKGGHASLLEYPQSVEENIIPFLKEFST